jgi:hypothetical protein
MIIGLISLSGKAVSQDSQTPPGLIESFERLSELSKEQYQKNKSLIQSKMNIVTDLTTLEEVKLAPEFVKNLIINSDEKFLLLSNKDECRFLSTLETNLLKTSEGNSDAIYIEYKNNDKLEFAAIPRQDFFEQIYKKKCLNNREFSILFNDVNAPKTIEGIKFTIPKTKQECSVIHKEWLDNSYTPYLCRVQQIIRRSPIKSQADYYQDKVPLMQKIYLDNLCGSLNSSEKFCVNYLKGDAWNRVVNSELPPYKMSYKCQALFNKREPLTKDEIKNCAAKLATDDAFCETRNSKDFPANYPLQSCGNLSLALNKGKLITDYQDCPGNIDNEALTNIHRLVSHFSQRKINSTRENCAGETNYTLARLNLDVKYEAGWPLKVCYLNRVDNKETCTTYIPGSRENEPLSEDKVVSKILYEQKGAPPKTTCRIVDSKTYNPLRSEFKYGCYIVNNAENCTTLSCDKKVIWAEKVQSDIRFIGKTNFDYFANAYMNERYSFVNLMNEVHGTQEREIRNFTNLSFYLENNPLALVHGIGCAEDLMPEIFQRLSINQCQPMPFIIDGVVKKNNENLLVSRIAIDDVHTPRLITWSNVFNAVSSYREIHPLGTWTLYGIKK